ncbi:SDR family NAD(P)-dependent oxidoreductase [Streptomyces sp. NPDC004393]|uniref:SDR family NAD(P)-dependent oxidoreductase n=1 Tax=Streptomyces sp. NPDC004533 TaxID=3154278 RepID=UPI0033B3B41F
MSRPVQRALGPDGGRIINISSAITRRAVPSQVVYAMSKGALDQLTLHFAQHLRANRGSWITHRVANTILAPTANSPHHVVCGARLASPADDSGSVVS